MSQKSRQRQLLSSPEATKAFRNAAAGRHYIKKLRAKQKPEPRVPEDLQGLQHTLMVLAHDYRRQKPKRAKEAKAALVAFRTRPRCPADLLKGEMVENRYTYGRGLDVLHRRDSVVSPRRHIDWDRKPAA